MKKICLNGFIYQNIPAFMNKYRTYNDSKELPLENYERIETTKDYYYMLKGYDANPDDNVEDYDVEELEKKFDEIVQECIVTLNHKSLDFSYEGKLYSSRLEKIKLEKLSEVIQLKIKYNAISGNTDNSDIEILFEEIIIQRSKDLNIQLQIISDKIDKYQNEINDLQNKIKKNTNTEETTDTGINDRITGVELILERTINAKEITLYRFILMENQAYKKMEQLNKMNQK